MLGSYEIRYCCDEQFSFLLTKIKNALKKTNCQIISIQDKITESRPVPCCVHCRMHNKTPYINTTILTRIEYDYKGQ